MELRDAIDGMATDACEMCHAHVARSAFINKGKPRDPGLVAWKGRAHFIEETAIDLKNDFEMSREQCAEKIDRPLLQRLREQRVIRVGERRVRDRPRLVPVESMLIDK